MKHEKACGTIVINDNKVLVIQQKQGFWGFPKGHMEQGENEIETAIRETKEETNLDVIIEDKTRFCLTYFIEDKNIHKEVVYFVAKVDGKVDIKPQIEEVNSIAWIDIAKVEDILTFDNLKELWERILNHIKTGSLSNSVGGTKN